MLLRALVVLLVLANIGYFAWTHGALAMFGTQPARFSETEPHRMTQQVRPQLLQVRKAEPATRP
jgi:hypothetical protein